MKQFEPGKPLTVLVFSLDGVRYGLPAAVVRRTFLAVEISPLPNAPDIVLGVVNVGGTLVPFVDLRRRFGRPAKALSPADKMVLCFTRRPLGFLADEVEGLRLVRETDLDEEPGLLSLVPRLKGVAKAPDGLVLIYDLDDFLSLQEETSLEKALGEASS